MRVSVCYICSIWRDLTSCKTDVLVSLQESDQERHDIVIETRNQRFLYNVFKITMTFVNNAFLKIFVLRRNYKILYIQLLRK